ncbi:MAG TPA: hypothetical protein VLJ59_03375 [Mycobacteriales bacterium]|nr:hypothetical protein [Mycobacteriales bacterium]
MNTAEPPSPSWQLPERPDPDLWDEPAMRAALAGHDIAAVYRTLQQCGYSQQRIGILTGQSQPQVSQITHHGRRIQSYVLLAHISQGLAIPPCYMGLGWCTRQNTGKGGSFT